MLGLREVHEHGPTRVAIDGAHALSGGADGVVALFPLKRWPQSTPLWARQCHSAAVTCVLLQDELHLAMSCGRDGHVFLHENIHAASAAASTSRLVCKVTGEVRCMHFDSASRRLFLAGDSLRCLRMAEGRFEVQTVPLVVPSPIAAVALSPCGTLLAMASTSGAVGVVSANSSTTATSTTPATAASVPEVRLALDKVLSPSVGKDDRCAFRMHWCRTAGGLHLLVPAATEVTLLRYTEADAAAGVPAKLRAVGGLHAEGFMNFFSVAAYPVSAHRACCLLASREGIFVGKFDDRTFLMTRHTSQSYAGAMATTTTAAGAAPTAENEEGHDSAHAKDGQLLTDVHVCEASGDVMVGLASGRVSVLPRASLKALDEQKEAEKKERRAEAKRKATGAVHVIGAETQDASQTAAGEDAVANHRGENEEEEEEDAKKRAPAGKSEKAKHQQRNSSSRTKKGQGDDDDFINDAESESGEDSASSSNSSSSSSDSDSDSDVDSNGRLAVRENLERVVVDLKASNADYVDDDEAERPSRWRDEDPRRVLVDAEREARRHREDPLAASAGAGGSGGAGVMSSRFLDDEAEEGSGSDESDSDAERGGDRRRRRRHGGGHDDDDDDEEENEEDEMDADMGSDVGEGSELGSQLHRGDRRTATTTGGGAGTALLDYAFQVGATPAGPEESCYLAYNTTGFILCTREGTTVHFHDVSNPAVRITERGVILMGALSPVGAGFIVAPASTNGGSDGASGGAFGESVDDEAPRLTVYYRTFVALGAQSDWRARLLPGETVRCMTAGIRHLAVATSRYLRIYSLSGLELAVLSKFPRIVAMAGTSSRRLMSGLKADFDPLAVVYLEGGEHKMEVMDVGSRSVAIAARPLPLTEGGGGLVDNEEIHGGNHHNNTGATTAATATHQLQWLGWSEDGPLHTVDTAGVVRMYTESWGGSWVPVYDPRSFRDQSYTLWVWGVNDEHLYAYRSVKTEAPYPAAVSTGLPVERAPLFVPLTRTATAAGGDRESVTWDHMLRRQIRADELKRHSSFYTPAIAKYDALHDAKIKELFQSALRAQMTSRAMDLATLLELRDNIEDCAREANSGGHAQLVQKLLMLFEMRVKAKSKRRCELPLEKTIVSEKERDELLRKLLVRERNGGKAAANNNNNSTTNNGNSNINGENPSAKGESASAARVPIDVENDDDAVRESPAKSVATTAVTATTDRSPDTGARRRVTFTVPESSPAPRPSALSSASSTVSSATTTTTTTTGGIGTAAISKPANPFAAKKNPAAPASTTAVTAATAATATAAAGRSDAKAARVQRSLVPQAAPTAAAPAATVKRTTFQTAAAPAAAAKANATTAVTAPPPTASLLGVDSQPAEVPETQPPATAEDEQTTTSGVKSSDSTLSTPPRSTHPHTLSRVDSASHAPGSHRVHEGDENDDEEEGASGGGRRPSEELSPSGGRPTGTTPSAGRGNEKAPLESTAVPTQRQPPQSTFIPRALPVNTEVSGSRRAPLDPFLADSKPATPVTVESYSPGGGAGGSSSSLVMGGSGDADGAPVSVEALLDVGHEDSQSTAPRSSSFGEALRKRYRADEEDENSNDVVVPSTSFARVEG